MGTIPKSSPKAYQSSTLPASPEDPLEDPLWYVDSGANNHVTGDVNILEQSSACTKNQ